MQMKLLDKLIVTQHQCVADIIATERAKNEAPTLGERFRLWRKERGLIAEYNALTLDIEYHQTQAQK